MTNTNAIILFPTPFAIHESGNCAPLSGLTQDDLDALSMAMFDDVVEQTSQLDGTDTIVFHNGETFSDDFVANLKKRVKYFEVQGDSFGEQVWHALERTLSDRYARIIVIFENNPILDGSFYRHVFDQLTFEDDCVVLGPTFEGSWYLLGLKSDHGSVSQLSSGGALLEPLYLFEHLCRMDTFLFPTRPHFSLNSPVRLERIEDELKASVQNDENISRRTSAVLKTLQKKQNSRRWVR